MLHVPTAQLDATPCVEPIPVVSGRNIAHSSRTTVQLAFVAADLCLDRVRLVPPTIKQAANVVGVSYGYARAATHIAYCRPDMRLAVENGRRPLIDPTSAPVLHDIWRATPASERDAFVRAHMSEIWKSLETVTA
jgi:hypothetical protein